LHLDVTFGNGPAVAGLRHFFNPSRASLRREIAAQFEKFRALDFPPIYWDGHTHLHLHPTVLRETLPIARALDFKVTRLVRDDETRGAIPLIFHALSRNARAHLDKLGIAYVDRVRGLARTGNVDTKW